MEKPIKYITSREDMKFLSSRQVLIEKERVEYGEYLLLWYEHFILAAKFQEGMEIVTNIKEKLKLRELQLKQ